MSEITSYIQTLELPAAPQWRGEANRGEPAPAFTSDPQAMTVGSQMVEFSKAVSEAIRPAISNGLLLGQLAAEKQTAGETDPAAYFSAFNDVMKKIGWQVTSSNFTQQVISEKNAELHKAIIPVVTAIFGPVAAASSIIIAVLNGLQSMDQEAPWITVFQKKSARVKTANLGLSYVDSGADGGATLKVAYFTLQASQQLVQVLFFKFFSSDATMKSGQCEMGLSPQTIAISQDDLQQKVGPFIIDNIKNIDI